jgi:hypothetical protein
MVYIKIVNEVKYVLGSCDKENHNIIKNARNESFNGEIYWFHINDLTSGHCLVYLPKHKKLNITNKTIACNYIKKYSRYKKLKELTFCYTLIDNIIICDKPGLVDFINIKELKYINHEDTIIYHYSDFNGGNSAEYIIPLSQRGEPPNINNYICYDDYIKEYNLYYNFDITSHRIGSGVYGLATEKQKDSYIFKLQNPLIISNTEECEEYMEISKLVNEFFKTKYITNKVKILSLFFQVDEDNIKKIINNCIKRFYNDFKNRKDMVMMPINYLMFELNYDGVYSKGTIFDSFSKGNILFTNYPSKKNKLPIKYIKRRKGVDEFIYKI